jgi:TIGR03009 family protein
MTRATLILTLVVLGVSQTMGQAPDRGAPAAGEDRPAAPAAKAALPAAPIDPAEMDVLLQKWERQSSLLKTLDATILRVDDAPAWGDREYYEGRALFKSPNLAFIDFSKIKLDEKKKPMRDPRKKGGWITTPYERIICTGDEVWQYTSDTQQIFVFPLGQDEQKKALEEGPLPFLFNMKAADARNRYEMTLMNKDNETYGVKIKPKLKEDQDSFSVAFVSLDRTYLLPRRIYMVAPDGKSSKDFRMEAMYPNRPVNAKNFEGKPLGPPWKLVRNPAGEQRPRAGVTRPRREGAAEPAAAGTRAFSDRR